MTAPDLMEPVDENAALRIQLDEQRQEIERLRRFQAGTLEFLQRLFQDPALVARILEGVDIEQALAEGNLDMQAALNAVLDVRDRAAEAADYLRRISNGRSNTLAILEGRA